MSVELRGITWVWNVATMRLQESEPRLGVSLARSCRPLAAERHADGKLTTVLGCWWAADLKLLGEETARQRLAEVLGPMLEDQIEIVMVPWPAGLAIRLEDDGEALAPPLMGKLTVDARAAADACETPLERWFFACAYAKGLRLECQHTIDHFRVDFAVPRYRVAAEVVGWETRHGPRERERSLGDHAWRVLSFSGKEVHADVDRCVAELQRMLPRESQSPARPPSPRNDRREPPPRRRF